MISTQDECCDKGIDKGHACSRQQARTQQEAGRGVGREGSGNRPQGRGLTGVCKVEGSPGWGRTPEGGGGRPSRAFAFAELWRSQRSDLFRSWLKQRIMSTRVARQRKQKRPGL